MSKPTGSNKSKSIRLQIDLPMDETPLTPGSIHLHINFDPKGRLSAKTISDKKRVSRCDTTSGYSSSSSSGLSSSSSTHSLNSSADFIDLNTSELLGKDVVGVGGRTQSQSVANCYDKLSYTPATKSSDLLDDCLNTSENIYEEISSYLETSGHVYVNQPRRVTNTTMEKRSTPIQYENLSSFASLMTTERTPRQCVTPQVLTSQPRTVEKVTGYRREYTLNEIFENLKKFKRQAKEQEILSSRPVSEAGKRENHSRGEHVYVNQRVNVSNATFV